MVTNVADEETGTNTESQNTVTMGIEHHFKIRVQHETGEHHHKLACQPIFNRDTPTPKQWRFLDFFYGEAKRGQ